jgi:hypothetical protein
MVADHVEPARSKAYHELGDGRRASSIAMGWLRPKPADRVRGVSEGSLASGGSTPGEY